MLGKTGRPTMPTMASAPVKLQLGGIGKAGGHRVVLYGAGGIGKTSAAAKCGKVAFIDLDESLPMLRPDGDIVVVGGIKTWPDLRSVLGAEGWEGIETIVLDTATKAEELAATHIVSTIPHEKGHSVNALDEYGFGKGQALLFDAFLGLLGDLDRHCRAGRNVVLVCHDCVTQAPNPAGEDWLRYEPRLQSPASGKSSIRLRVREWADHLLFLGYDIVVNKDGKGKGSGTRTCYVSEMPYCMAKSRTMRDPFAVVDGSELWTNIKNKEA